MLFIRASKNQTRILVWLVLFLPFALTPVAAQKYFFDNYSIKQGLSEQKVYTLLQDSKDYIWLGMANGVSRFDGKSFRNFTSQDSLASGGVKCIVEDSLGYIWLGHLNGAISRFDGHKFVKVSFDSIGFTGDITSIQQIHDKIWFTSVNDGAVESDFPVKNVRHMTGRQYRGKDGLSDQVFGASVNRDGSLICIADAGLRKFNKEDKKFENF